MSSRWWLLRVLGALMVVAAVAPAPAGGAARFGDVPAVTYYTEAVQWMVDEEITTGTGPGCFDPHGVVTRGQAAAFMWRMEGEPAAPAHAFGDVVLGWQQGPVSWMADTGVTTGTSDTTYSPDLPLTRGQLAALLWRLAGEPAATPHSFVDVHATWQQGAVSWMAATGITTGTSITTFSPGNPVTRAQVATFFWRYSGTPNADIDATAPLCDSARSDTFNGGATNLLAGDASVWQVANPGTADVMDINSSVDGSLVIVPRSFHNNGWYAASEGPMAYQAIDGDFAAAIRIRVVSVDDPNGLTAPGNGYNSGGFVLRSATDHGDWVMYNIGGQTAASGFAREVKTTVDRSSVLQLISTDVREYRLLVCKVGAEIRYFHGAPDGDEWTAETIEHSRPDIGDAVHVGIVANAWQSSPRPSVQVDAIAFGHPESLDDCTTAAAAV